MFISHPVLTDERLVLLIRYMHLQKRNKFRTYSKILKYSKIHSKIVQLSRVKLKSTLVHMNGRGKDRGREGVREIEETRD